MSKAGLWTLLALLATSCKGGGLSEGEEESGSGSGGGPPLSKEAIANIASTAAAMAVLGGAICYLLLCFDRQERMERVRTAQERNRQITRQLEAARQAKKQKKQQSAGNGAEQEASEEGGSLIFSQRHHSHLEEDDSSGPRGTSEPLVSSLTTKPS